VRSRYKRIVYKRIWVASLTFQSVWTTFSSYSAESAVSYNENELYRHTVSKRSIAVFPILADVVKVKVSGSTAHWSIHFIRLNGWLRRCFTLLITPVDIDGIGQNWEDSNILYAQLSVGQHMWHYLLDSRHVRAIQWPSGRWRARRRIDAGRLYGRERARGHVQPRCRGGGGVGRGKGCCLRHRSGGGPPASRGAHGRGRHSAAQRTCARQAGRPTRRTGGRVGLIAARRGA